MRTAMYVDGFNLYHALKRLGRDNKHLKWLDLWQLAKLVGPKDAELQNVFFCSAYPTWRPADQLARHRAYVAALEAQGVTFVEGRFKRKTDNRCRQCGSTWASHEEKETDVNLAIHMLRGAHRDEWDMALLVSNDTDLTSTVAMLARDFPEKRVRIVTPPGRGSTHQELRAVASGVTRLKAKHLRKCLLPGQLVGLDGKSIRRPTEYDPPII